MPVDWRPLAAGDLPELLGLAARVLAADGGLPIAAQESFVTARFPVAGGATLGGFGADGLVAAAAVRSVGPGSQAATGLVHPGWRGQGLGSHLVDWAVATAGTGALRFETESLTPAAETLLFSRGFLPAFAEDVMRADLTAGVPEAVIPDGVSLSSWSDALAGRFFAVYEASFIDRPGFPGWSQEQWVRWHTEDADFAPHWTLLATRDSNDIGFVACARGAWITQLGVVASARGDGLGTALTTEALQRMYAAGETSVHLDVNVNNPGAARLYDRLGFHVVGRRARYERLA